MRGGFDNLALEIELECCLSPLCLQDVVPRVEQLFLRADRRPICCATHLNGASMVRTKNGMITIWSDYYDGLISRRTALASYFTEWVEY